MFSAPVTVWAPDARLVAVLCADSLDIFRAANTTSTRVDPLSGACPDNFSAPLLLRSPLVLSEAEPELLASFSVRSVESVFAPKRSLSWSADARFILCVQEDCSFLLFDVSGLSELSIKSSADKKYPSQLALVATCSVAELFKDPKLPVCPPCFSYVWPISEQNDFISVLVVTSLGLVVLIRFNLVAPLNDFDNYKCSLPHLMAYYELSPWLSQCNSASYACDILVVTGVPAQCHSSCPSIYNSTDPPILIPLVINQMSKISVHSKLPMPKLICSSQQKMLLTRCFECLFVAPFKFLSRALLKKIEPNLDNTIGIQIEYSKASKFFMVLCKNGDALFYNKKLALCDLFRNFGQSDAFRTKDLKSSSIICLKWWNGSQKSAFLAISDTGLARVFHYPSWKPVSPLVDLGHAHLAISNVYNDCLFLAETCDLTVGENKHQDDTKLRDLVETTKGRYNRARPIAKFLDKTIQYATNTLLWHFEDSADFSPSLDKTITRDKKKHLSPKIDHRKSFYRLVRWIASSPMEILLALIAAEDYANALELAKNHNLSTDLVYQSHWCAFSIVYSVDESIKLLTKIKDKLWVLQACLDFNPPPSYDASSYLELIKFAVSITFNESLQQNQNEEGSEKALHLQFRALLMRNIDFFEIFMAIFGASELSVKFLDFRSENLLSSAFVFAKNGNFEHLEKLFAVYPAINYFRLAIISRIAPMVDPEDYKNLLPTPENLKCCSKECEFRHQPAWQNKMLLDFTGNNQENWSSDLETVSEFKNNMTLEDWYMSRAVEIEQLCGSIEYPQKILEIACLIPGIDAIKIQPVLNNLNLFSSIVYYSSQSNINSRINSSKLSYTEFLALEKSEIVSFLLQNSDFSTKMLPEFIVSPTKMLPEFIVSPTKGSQMMSPSDFVHIVQKIDSTFITIFNVLERLASKGELSNISSVLKAIQKFVPPDLQAIHTVQIIYSIAASGPKFFREIEAIFETIPKNIISTDIQRTVGLLDVQLAALELFNRYNLQYTVRQIADTTDQFKLVDKVLENIDNQNDAAGLLKGLDDLVILGFFNVPGQKLYQNLLKHCLEIGAFETASIVARRCEMNDMLQCAISISNNYLDKGDPRKSIECLDIVPIAALESRKMLVEALNYISKLGIQISSNCTVQQVLEIAAQHLSESVYFEIARKLRVDQITTLCIFCRLSPNQQRVVEIASDLIAAIEFLEYDQICQQMCETMLVVSERFGNDLQTYAILYACYRKMPSLSRIMNISYSKEYLNPRSSQFQSKKYHFEPFFNVNASVKLISEWLDHPEAISENNPNDTIMNSTTYLPVVSSILSCKDPQSFDTYLPEALLYAYLQRKFLSKANNLMSQEYLKSAADLITNNEEREICLIKLVKGKEKTSALSVLENVPDVDYEKYQESIEYRLQTIQKLSHSLPQTAEKLAKLEGIEQAEFLKLWISQGLLSNSGSTKMLENLPASVVCDLKNHVKGLLKETGTQAKIRFLYSILAVICNDPSYLERVKLCDEIERMKIPWSVPVLCAHYFSGNREYFTALFKIYLHSNRTSTEGHYITISENIVPFLESLKGKDQLNLESLATSVWFRRLLKPGRPKKSNLFETILKYADRLVPQDVFQEFECFMILNMNQQCDLKNFIAPNLSTVGWSSEGKCHFDNLKKYMDLVNHWKVDISRDMIINNSNTLTNIITNCIIHNYIDLKEFYQQLEEQFPAQYADSFDIALEKSINNILSTSELNEIKKLSKIVAKTRHLRYMLEKSLEVSFIQVICQNPCLETDTEYFSAMKFKCAAIKAMPEANFGDNIMKLHSEWMQKCTSLAESNDLESDFGEWEVEIDLMNSLMDQKEHLERIEAVVSIIGPEASDLIIKELEFLDEHLKGNHVELFNILLQFPQFDEQTRLKIKQSPRIETVKCIFDLLDGTREEAQAALLKFEADHEAKYMKCIKEIRGFNEEKSLDDIIKDAGIDFTRNDHGFNQPLHMCLDPSEIVKTRYQRFLMAIAEPLKCRFSSHETFVRIYLRIHHK